MVFQMVKKFQMRMNRDEMWVTQNVKGISKKELESFVKSNPKKFRWK